jgi:DNA modification methylase
VNVLVLRADARDLPLPDASVDLIVTSPPYFGLRSYTDGGAHYAGQIGSEATPAEWLTNMLDCTREWLRVLKPTGSIFVNCGDKYDSGTTTARINPGTVKDGQGQGWYQGTPRVSFGQPKSLLGLPWRYALACIDQLGLILRAEIIWAKPNGLPESVTDRVRRAHEQVFHFTRLPRYYSAVDEIREPHYCPSRKDGGIQKHSYGEAYSVPEGARRWHPKEVVYNPLGKLPGSVWSIPSQPLAVPPHLGVDHFAAFPMELPRRLILGWSPPGVCAGCGEGRRPVTDKRLVNVWHDKPPQDSRYTGNEHAHLNNRKAAGDVMMRTFGSSHVTITGYICGCSTPWPVDAVQPSPRPAVVLDPFGGTGTTALLAHTLGRTGITCDLSADYCRIAAWRTTDRGEIARAMQVDKPAPVSDLQDALFEVTA